MRDTDVLKKELIEFTKRRIEQEIAPQSSLRYLRELDIAEGFDAVIMAVYLYTRPKRGNTKTYFLAEVISAIGHNFRGHYKLKKDSSNAAKTGAFFLWSFTYFGIIEASYRDWET